ncbi:thiamine pyrophosphokinase [Naviculisporaceae sp. PSN 640]
MDAPATPRASASAENLFEWYPRQDLFTSHNEPRGKFGIIVLNQPIDLTYRHVVPRLWKSASYHIAADGGSNSIYDFEKETKQHLTDVNVVIGDLDSIRPDVKAHFSNKDVCPNTRIILDSSVDATDFGKAVNLVRSSPEFSGQAKDLLIFGGLGGRIDQALSIFHHLYLFQSDSHYHDGRMLLYTGEGLAFLLKSGTHRIHVREPGMADRFEKHVGILPIGEPSVVTTKGLEWDVTEWATGFGGQVSTSNHILPETQVVEVTTTKDVVFTMTIKKLEED